MSPDFRESLERFLRTVPLRNLTNDELWARFRVAKSSTSDYQFGFAVLLERCGGRVYGTCFRKLQNEAIAEEAFQEAFCALISSRSRYKTYADATNWLFRVAVNKALDAMRKRHPAGPLPIDLEAKSEASVEGSELNAAITAIIAELPLAERMALELMGLESLSAKEAAEQLRSTAEAVQKACERGRAKLQAALSKRGLLAIGAVPTLDAALASVGRASTLPPARAATVAETILRKTAVTARSVSGTLRAALVMLGLAAAGGLTWAAWPKPETADPPIPQSPVLKIESVPDRTLRLFRTEVAPKMIDALGPVVGSGEVVLLEPVEAFDTRLKCRFELRVRLSGAPARNHRMEIYWDTRDRKRYWVHLDKYGTGEMQPLDVENMLRVALPFGKDFTAPSKPILNALAMLNDLPTDEQTKAEAARHNARVDLALDRLIGDWYEGDVSNWKKIRRTQDGDLTLSGVKGSFITEPDKIWFDRQGRLQGIGQFESMVLPSADGRKLQFVNPHSEKLDFVWTRMPVKAP